MVVSSSALCEARRVGQRMAAVAGWTADTDLTRGNCNAQAVRGLSGYLRQPAAAPSTPLQLAHPVALIAGRWSVVWLGCSWLASVEGLCDYFCPSPEYEDGLIGVHRVNLLGDLARVSLVVAGVITS